MEVTKMNDAVIYLGCVLFGSGLTIVLLLLGKYMFQDKKKEK